MPSNSNKLSSLPWVRIGAESTAIVLSILLAFSIDALWDDRSDSIQERAVLQALVDDFQSAGNQFDQILDGHTRLYSAMGQILTWAEEGIVPVDERSDLDFLLGHIFIRSIFNPPLGAVETLLSSGRLDLLENPELVTELTRWSAIVQDLRENQQSVANHFNETIYPYLNTRLNLQDLDKGIPFPGGVPWEQQATNAYQLVSDREFHNIIYVHWVLSWNVDMKMPAVSQSIAKITDLARLELD